MSCGTRLRPAAEAMDRLRKAANMTPGERRAQMEKDPKVMTILKQNGLSPQEYLTGVPALRMALVAAQGMADGPHIAGRHGRDRIQLTPGRLVRG